MVHALLKRHPFVSIAGIWLLCVAAGTFLPRTLSFIEITENWLSDLRLVTLGPRIPQRSDIIMVTITEDTLGQLPYRFPFDRGVLADTVQHLDNAGVRAIGLDILFDQPTEAEKDARLAKAVADASAPVVVGWAKEAEGLTQKQIQFLDRYLPDAVKGASNLVKAERDGTVRWVFPGLETKDGYRDGFAAALAKSVGIDAPKQSVPLFFRRGLEGEFVPFKSFPIHIVKVLPKEWFAGKVVLIGSDLPNTDRHRTPFAALVGNNKGTIPGLIIHAFALAQLLDGAQFSESGIALELAIAAAAAAIGLALTTLELPIALIVALGLLSFVSIWAVGGLFLIGGPLTPLFAPSMTLAGSGGIGAVVAGRRHRRNKTYAEAMVRRRTQSLHTVVENSFDGIVITNTDGIINTKNAAADALMGWLRNDAIGSSISEFIEDADDIRSRFCDLDEEGNAPSAADIVAVEREIVRQDGTSFTMELVVNTARMSFEHHEESSTPAERVSYVYTFRDVTERRRAREAQKQALDEALAASRAKSEFLANMSHELRTPLNAVIGLSEVIRSEAMGPIGADYKEFVEDIHESGQHLLDIINDILDTSKIEMGQLDLQADDVAIGALIESCVRLIQRRADDGAVRVTAELGATPSILNADERLVKQMLLNLLSNAVKFTPRGGSVVVRTMAREDGAELIQVQDTGIGIDPDDMERALAPFGQVDGSLQRKAEGTGLGLPLVKSMIEAHGGELAIDSIPGTGTTVSLVFPAERVSERPEATSPLVTENGEAPTPVPQALEDDSSEHQVREDVAMSSRREPDDDGALRVLVAEDNRPNQLVIQAMLTAWEFKVDFAANGREAVEAVRDRTYDVILMDIHMPEMDGLEATAEIRTNVASAQNTPIIAVTASAGPNDRAQFLAAGMNDHVPKPINPQDLYRAIWHHCDLAGREEKSSPSEIGTAEEDDIPSIESAADQLSELNQLLEASFE